jgi:hypothetical protein
MDSFRSGRCEECNKENILRRGAECARCLALIYWPTNDRDTEEESPIFSLDYLAVA